METAMNVWVLAADSSRARLFQASSRTGDISEVEDMLHPASRLQEHALVTDRAGRDVAPGGGRHTLGREHDAEREELERFAREVGDKLCAGRKAGRYERLHVLAAPRFLGALRKHLDAETRAALISEQDANVTSEAMSAIRARLPKRL
jgi:protein required for attachment to host cells